ncbi:MAG: TPM domain-containing protein, partial [Nanoarchaeota archaeon]
MNISQRFGKLTGILLIFVILLISAKAYQITYFINDYSGLLSEAEIAEIEPILKEIYDSGTAEYAIVIIDSLEGQDIEGYAYKLAEGNLGDTEKNNGLLLLIALNDRKYRFEVGRGLEPVLPDIIVGRLGRKYIGPNFKIGEYGKGILEASIAIKDILSNNTDSPYYEDKKPDSLSTGMIIFLILFFVFFFLIIFISSSTKK